MSSTQITIVTDIDAPVDHVWKLWNEPAHIVRWNHASDDWHTTEAENDLTVGGAFRSRMEAKDGSFGFDFGGVYETIEPHQLIQYRMEDGRQVRIEFVPNGERTSVTEVFDAETENPVDMQQAGWQAILDNFKRYAEQSA